MQRGKCGSGSLQEEQDSVWVDGWRRRWLPGPVAPVSSRRRRRSVSLTTVQWALLWRRGLESLWSTVLYSTLIWKTCCSSAIETYHTRWHWAMGCLRTRWTVSRWKDASPRRKTLPDLRPSTACCTLSLAGVLELLHRRLQQREVLFLGDYVSKFKENWWITMAEFEMQKPGLRRQQVGTKPWTAEDWTVPLLLALCLPLVPAYNSEQVMNSENRTLRESRKVSSSSPLYYKQVLMMKNVIFFFASFLLNVFVCLEDFYQWKWGTQNKEALKLLRSELCKVVFFWQMDKMKIQFTQTQTSVKLFFFGKGQNGNEIYTNICGHGFNSS